MKRYNLHHVHKRAKRKYKRKYTYQATSGKKGKQWVYILSSVGILILAVLLLLFLTPKTKEDKKIKQLPVKEMPQSKRVTKKIPSVRVLLLGENKKMVYQTISLSCDKGMTYEKDKKTYECAPNEEVTFTKENWTDDKKRIVSGGKITFVPKEKEAKIFVKTDGINKGYGYAGTMEIFNQKGKMALVNEVDTEEYLLSVLPSEMPQSYGLEALKAQAICARSYVYVQATETAYPEFEAQIDDTVSFQVYQNNERNDLSTQAVNETKDCVLLYDNAVCNTLYYSTSCGFTQAGSLFLQPDEYLASQYIGTKMPEESFENYIRKKDENAYEKDEKYFRWKVTLDTVGKEENMLHQIFANSSDETIHISKKLSKKVAERSKKQTLSQVVGPLTSLKALKRNAGGAIESLQLDFAAGTVVVEKELLIRKILGAAMVKSEFNDGSVTENDTQLYSAAFVFDMTGNGYILYGGGYGHGVGMSQNGAKNMASLGLCAKDILLYFYPNAAVGKL